MGVPRFEDPSNFFWYGSKDRKFCRADGSRAMCLSVWERHSLLNRGQQLTPLGHLLTQEGYDFRNF